MAHLSLSDFLVQEFTGNGSGSYGSLPMNRKRDLQRHLNNILIREPEKVLPIFEEDTGVKLHFNVARGPEGWDLIPNETFMKKIAFLADKTLITFPFHDMDYSKDEDLQSLLGLIEAVAPFMEKEIFYILPSYDARRRLSLTTDTFREDHGLISANFSQKMLLRQLKEDVTNELNLYQPVFKEITFTDIIEVRGQNEDRYRHMQRVLAEQFTMEKDKQTKLLNVIQKIDLKVTELANKFNNLQSTYRAESFMTLTKVVTDLLPFIASVCPPVGLIAQFIGAGKSLSGIGAAAKGMVMKGIQNHDFMDQDFYLYWRIKNPRTKL